MLSSSFTFKRGQEKPRITTSLRPRRSITMKFAAALLALVGSAAAFAPASQSKVRP
jgi:hypothetical protein